MTEHAVTFFLAISEVGMLGVCVQNAAIERQGRGGPDALGRLSSGSVHCVVTSVPLVRAGGDVNECVNHVRMMFRQLRPVLVPTATVWVNLADVATKDRGLAGVPWRVAFDVQRDGWIVRNAVVWRTERPDGVAGVDAGPSTQTLFLFVMQASYYFNLDAIRVPVVTHRRAVARPTTRPAPPAPRRPAPPRGKNPGDLWIVADDQTCTSPTTLPAEVVRRAIMAGCPPDGVVLEPFASCPCVETVTRQLGRHYVGITAPPGDPVGDGHERWCA